MSDSVLMPKELTAENGAKYIFLGEFFEVIEVNCPECMDVPYEDCEICNGEQLTQKVYVSWDTIKQIYKLAVEKLSITK